MSKEKQLKEFEFTLSEPVTIHKSGQSVPVAKILLKCPNSRQQRDRLIIKNGFLYNKNQSTATATDTEQKANDVIDNLTESQKILGGLFSTKTADEMDEILNAFKRLLLDGCGTFEGITATDHYLNQIDGDDFDSMLGEYIANFILPSWMKQLMKS